MIFHSQLAWSPNQHLNPALTSEAESQIIDLQIYAFSKPLAGFLNQKAPAGRNILFISPPPPKLFPPFLPFDEILECQRTETGTEGTAGSGVPDLHVNSFQGGYKGSLVRIQGNRQCG
ncbi:hypothetical protein CEXT_536301 [Caerostris extrusa]|uniref:Uncharacterized protein n=1 Tax=Caerostris extrusa TaxID=172846 RepID=A0AAV4PP56_CAEEX|nr:hypothetical protein CEXT_536301 [Caerostris extrusa]